MTDETRNKGGRPPKAQKMRDNVLHVYFPSEGDIDQLKEAASLSGGQSLSTWARLVLLNEAKRILAAK